jgi:hypothetical protein
MLGIVLIFWPLAMSRRGWGGSASPHTIDRPSENLLTLLATDVASQPERRRE